MSAETWRVGGASVTGSAHVRTKRPNQDALRWLPEGGAGFQIAAAVSDGHGASAHFRSGEGAFIAANKAAELLHWNGDGHDGDDDEDLAADLVRAWREGVSSHLAANPYTPDLQVDPRRPFIPYGATLLAFAAGRHVVTIAQIGDGDLILGFPDGRLERPLGSDAGLVGEETYSLCLEEAELRFRVASLWREEGGEWPDFALLCTDGVSKSFRDDGAFTDAVEQLRRLATGQWDKMLGALPDWLSQVSANGSGDDSTLCIALRQS